MNEDNKDIFRMILAVIAALVVVVSIIFIAGLLTPDKTKQIHQRCRIECQDFEGFILDITETECVCIGENKSK